MDKSKIESLEKQLEALNIKYKLVAIKKIKADEEFIEQLMGIGKEIHKVKSDILAEKMPFGMEDI